MFQCRCANIADANWGFWKVDGAITVGPLSGLLAHRSCGAPREVWPGSGNCCGLPKECISSSGLGSLKGGFSNRSMNVSKGGFFDGGMGLLKGSFFHGGLGLFKGDSFTRCLGGKDVRCFQVVLNSSHFRSG